MRFNGALQAVEPSLDPLGRLGPVKSCPLSLAKLDRALHPSFFSSQ